MYQELLTALREAAVLATVAETLGWDQETMMPERAAPFRAEESALLSRLVHERLTNPRLAELLAGCEADRSLTADPDASANLREIRRDLDRAAKLPSSLVAEISETASLAMEAWKAARSRSDFAEFLPWLTKQVELHRRKAECYGAPAGGELYDALLQDFEPETTSAEVERVFGPLRDALRPLVDAVASSGRSPGRAPASVPVERQQAFNRSLLERIGFDLRAGRLDVSAHPFSAGLGPGDTRLTSRYRDDGFLDAVGSTMHEAGHGLYEQGLPKEERFGQPLAEAASLAIHESQSRLWENHVGRSRAFWNWAMADARRTCGAALESLGPEDLYRAMNRVAPHPIRVESDEVTYHMHVMLRFDLERAMIRGELAPRDLPGAWNERMRTDLGLAIENDARGCLQDVHWSAALIGYFPTYTLGSLYAAQFFEAARAAIGDLDQRLGRGDFSALLEWLRREVHAHGRRWPAAELCRRVTGEPLSHGPLIRHLNPKLEELYGLGRGR
jgi:carboxypeptidase Taq